MDSIARIRKYHDLQGQDGVWDCNDYQLGFFNGLELALAYFEEREPQLRELKMSERWRKEGNIYP